MSMLKVGVIDSGIEINKASLMKYVVGGYDVVRGKAGIEQCDDEIGHGTACADLITRAFEPGEIGVFVYKVCGAEIAVDIGTFGVALEKVLDDRVDVVNCSLGTIDPDAKYKLCKIVARCSSAGTILICAWNDEGYTTWPAAFDTAVAVKSGEQTDQNSWVWVSDKKSHVLFRGTKQRVQWKNGAQIFMGGSSFATPLCTRVVARALANGSVSKNPSSVFSYLEKNASSKNIVDLNQSPLIPWNTVHKRMKKVGIYPFFKETHGFVRFRKELPYDIAWIADFKHSKAAGKKTDEIIRNSSESFYVNAGLPNDSSGIDSLIIGYLDLAGEAAGKDLLEEAYDYAFQRKINVFSLLPSVNQAQWKESFSSEGLWLETPLISYESALGMIQKVPEKKALDVPVIGVFGTSSQQGKFTLQLALRYELQKRGFRVGQIGTEHQSGCFGIDFTFPSGYGAQHSLKIPMDFHIPLLRRVLSEMDKGQFDCVIVGAQSGLLSPNPYYYGGIYSELFYSAVLSDKTILIRNTPDSEEHIRRIESYVYAKTGVPVFQTIPYEELVSSEEEIVPMLVDRLVEN